MIIIVYHTISTVQCRTSYLPNEILWGHRFEHTCIAYDKNITKVKELENWPKLRIHMPLALFTIFVFFVLLKEGVQEKMCFLEFDNFVTSHILIHPDKS